MKNKIAIHSVPRSGSSWLGSIFDSHPEVVYKYQPLFSYVLKGFLNRKSTKEEIARFFNKLEHTEDDFLDQKEAKKKGIMPVFKKKIPSSIVYKEVRYHHILKNLLETDQDIKIIGLVRNPLAVIHSWLNAPKEFKKELGWKVEEEWRYAPKKNLEKPEEFNGFEKWKEATQLFEQLKEDYPNRFFLVRYEELLDQPVETVEALFNFAGLEMDEQTKNFLKASRSSSVEDAYGVYRKKTTDDKWKTELPSYITEAIQADLQGTKLDKYLD